MIQQPKQSKERAGVSMHFLGGLAVQKRLASSGMQAGKISCYRGRLGRVWEADTDKGKRWVSYCEKGGSKISRMPPAVADGKTT